MEILACRDTTSLFKRDNKIEGDPNIFIFFSFRKMVAGSVRQVV